jgi:ppGpp synthetase/RelA/SpoT-type nucleotidyltranferase
MESLEKPSNLDSYKSFVEYLTGKNIMILKEYYEKTTTNMKREFCESDFLRNIQKGMDELNDRYSMDKKFRLLEMSKCLQMQTKEFDDVIEKCYRNDILQNPKWDKKIQIGDYDWTHPLNCFEKLNDTIRSRIVIRYLDGVELVLGILEEVSKRHNIKYDNVEYKADERGYYGVHFVIKYPFEIQDINGRTREIFAKIELQICTQISEVVNELLHQYYEKQRLEPLMVDRKWQWDYDSDEFAPAYIGHISHYIEGMIMQARQKVGGLEI